MKIWIDADAAPRDVKEVVFKAANREGVETVLVANQRIPIPANAATVSMVTVREGANVADQYIVLHSQPGDLVVTADIPLAAELVAKRVDVIDPRGKLTTAGISRVVSQCGFYGSNAGCWHGYGRKSSLLGS